MDGEVSRRRDIGKKPLVHRFKVNCRIRGSGDGANILPGDANWRQDGGSILTDGRFSKVWARFVQIRFSPDSKMKPPD